MTYDKKSGVKLSDHFNLNDFDCHCTRLDCKTTLVAPLLIEGLELFLRIAGDFKINSGFRCEAHNKEVGGTINSYHLKGMAADCESILGFSGRQMGYDAEAISAFYNGGIGTYQHFCHVDVRGHMARWNMSTAC